LSTVLDSGISLIDTSPDCGALEELIGEFIPRRD
jgi:aryl-alcohol dehydrogenase-like predicted oxidoreductase